MNPQPPRPGGVQHGRGEVHAFGLRSASSASVVPRCPPVGKINLFACDRQNGQASQRYDATHRMLGQHPLLAIRSGPRSSSARPRTRARFSGVAQQGDGLYGFVSMTASRHGVRTSSARISLISTSQSRAIPATAQKRMRDNLAWSAEATGESQEPSHLSLAQRLFAVVGCCLVPIAVIEMARSRS